jgi:hypothetical protein
VKLTAQNADTVPHVLLSKNHPQKNLGTVDNNSQTICGVLNDNPFTSPVTIG